MTHRHRTAARRPSTRRLARLALLGTTLLGPMVAASLHGRPLIGEARADERATVMVFADPAEAADDVARALGPGVRVVPSKKLADALAKKGLAPKTGKLHAALGDAGKKQALADELRKLELGADRLVIVSIKPARGGGREVRSLSVAAGSGASSGEGAVALAPTDDRVAVLRRSLGVEGASSTSPATATTPAPAGSAPSPAASAQPPPPPPTDAGPADDAPPGEPSGAVDRSDVTRAVVTAFAGLEGTARRLTYSDPLSSNVRPYSITGAPSPTLGLELYPLARTSVPVLRDLGLVAGGAAAVGLSSRAADGEKITTRFLRYELGLRYRLRLGEGPHPAALGLEAGYSAVQFHLADTSSLGGADPSVDDRFLRFGLDARVPLGPVVLLARAGVGRLLQVGIMGDQFPRGRGGIVDGRLGLGVPLGSVVEGRFWFDYTRAFFDLRPVPGDAYVAGGAVDTYAILHLDALVHF